MKRPGFMKALLNGKNSVWLRPDDAILAEYDAGGTGRTPYLAISRPSCGWRVQLDNICPSHLSQHTTSMVGDFLFLYWEEQDLLCFAGYKRFYLISGESGRVAASQDLEFTNKESIDFLQLSVNVSKDKLIVVSTKLGWLIELDKEAARKIAIPGLAESLVRERNGFMIGYINTAKIDLPKSVMFVE
jgi:hypothetical protein